MKQYLGLLAFTLGFGLAACGGPTPVPAASPPAGEAIVVPGKPQVIILSPPEDAVVNAPQVEIIGQTTSDAVLTFNDEIVIAGPDGAFMVTVPLDEGPNLVQMVASDAEGNETTFELTVTYEPQSRP